METESIDFEDIGYKDKLLGLLRDKVFHVTTAKAFENIQKDGFISENQDAKYPLNPTSLNSFGRCRGWVCLFDLRGKSDKEIENGLNCYYFLMPSWFKELNESEHYTESRLVYLYLSHAYYKDLVPTREASEARKNGKPSHSIPEVECWYPGNIPIGHIEKSLCVRIRHTFNLNHFVDKHTYMCLSADKTIPRVKRSKKDLL